MNFTNHSGDKLVGKGSSPDPYNTPLRKAVDVCPKVVFQELERWSTIDSIDPSKGPGEEQQRSIRLIRFFLMILTDYRFYNTVSVSEISDFWNTKIRPDEILVDAVMNCTARFQTYFADQGDQAFSLLVQTLAPAAQDSRYVAMDSTLYDRLPSAEDLEVQFKNNPWYAFLALCSLSDLSVSDILQFSSRPANVSSSRGSEE